MAKKTISLDLTAKQLTNLAGITQVVVTEVTDINIVVAAGSKTLSIPVEGPVFKFGDVLKVTETSLTIGEVKEEGKRKHNPSTEVMENCHY